MSTKHLYSEVYRIPVGGYVVLDIEGRAGTMGVSKLTNGKALGSGEVPGRYKAVKLPPDNGLSGYCIGDYVERVKPTIETLARKAEGNIYKIDHDARFFVEKKGS
jgi:hypothetical protein